MTDDVLSSEGPPRPSPAAIARATIRRALRAEAALGQRLVPKLRRSTSTQPRTADALTSISPQSQGQGSTSSSLQRGPIPRNASTPSIGDQPHTDVAGPSVEPLGPHRPLFADPPLDRAARITHLDQLDRDHVRACQKCRLCQTRTQTVFGVGDPEADIFFIGEGPGENEDLRGEPFVGRAGELLTKMIGAMGLSRERVYIANIVKCRPPNNRAPMPDETAACTPYLEQQLALVRPRAIVTLGLPATQYMLQSRDPMSRLRGRWHTWRGIDLMPTYHPAYVLRQYTPETRQAVWSDLQLVMQKIGLKIPAKTGDSPS